MFKRKPDIIIGGVDNPYLLRWYLIPRNPIFNIYLHKFLRSDDDRALHDHPWLFNMSILLKGAYYEHVFKKRKGVYARGTLPGVARKYRRRGSMLFRWGSAPHRIELEIKCNLDDDFKLSPPGEKPVWTIFITGARVREWGFYCPKGFRKSADFLKPDNDGRSEVGRGCD